MSNEPTQQFQISDVFQHFHFNAQIVFGPKWNEKPGPGPGRLGWLAWFKMLLAWGGCHTSMMSQALKVMWCPPVSWVILRTSGSVMRAHLSV